MDKTAVFIEVRYSDGSGERAEGDQARQIWSWLMGTQGLACIHGAEYRGPKFTEFRSDEARQ